MPYKIDFLQFIRKFWISELPFISLYLHKIVFASQILRQKTSAMVVVSLNETHRSTCKVVKIKQSKQLNIIYLDWFHKTERKKIKKKQQKEIFCSSKQQ